MANTIKEIHHQLHHKAKRETAFERISTWSGLWGFWEEYDRFLRQAYPNNLYIQHHLYVAAVIAYSQSYYDWPTQDSYDLRQVLMNINAKFGSGDIVLITYTAFTNRDKYQPTKGQVEIELDDGQIVYKKFSVDLNTGLLHFLRHTRKIINFY